MPEIISYDKLSYVPKLLATTFGHPTKVRGTWVAVPGGAWDAWRCLVVPGGAWWCLAVPGGAWRWHDSVIERR